MLDEVLKKVSHILLRPKEFFKGLSKEITVKPAFRYYAFVSLFAIIANFIISFLIANSFTAMFNQFNASFQGSVPSGLGIAPFLIVGVLAYLLGLGMSFVSGVVMAGWLWLWGGRRGYAKAYQLAVYSSTPSLVLGWFPYVGGLVGSIWGLVVLITGAKELYNFSTGKAVVVFVIPMVLIIIFVMLLAALIAMGIAALSLSGSQPTY